MKDSDDTAYLEKFWDNRNSAIDESAKPTEDASTFDPSMAASSILETLGPLVFPIYRALLLRRRVLIVSQPPLLPVCNYGK